MSWTGTGPNAARPVKVKPVTENESKPRSKAVPIVIVLLGLAFVVGSHFLKGLGEEEGAVESTAAVASETTAAVEQPAAEMPDGAEAVPADSLQSEPRGLLQGWLQAVHQ